MDIRGHFERAVQPQFYQISFKITTYSAPLFIIYIAVTSNDCGASFDWTFMVISTVISRVNVHWLSWKSCLPLPQSKNLVAFKIKIPLLCPCCGSPPSSSSNRFLWIFLPLCFECITNIWWTQTPDSPNNPKRFYGSWIPKGSFSQLFFRI